MSIKEKTLRQSWREKKLIGERGSWSHLSSVFTNNFPLLVTHVHWFQSPFPLWSCQLLYKEVGFKAVLSLLPAPVPFWCAHSLWRSPNKISKLSRVFFFLLFFNYFHSFLISMTHTYTHKTNKNKKRCLAFKYIYNCIQVCVRLTVGRRLPLQQHLSFTLPLLNIQ